MCLVWISEFVICLIGKYLLINLSNEFLGIFEGIFLRVLYFFIMFEIRFLI